MAKEEKKNHKERSADARIMVAQLLGGKATTKEIIDTVSVKCNVGRAAVNDFVRAARKSAGIHKPLPKSMKHLTNYAAKPKVEVAPAPVTDEPERTSDPEVRKRVKEQLGL